MKLINTLICICLAYCGFAADYTISLAVNGFGGQKTYLTKVETDDVASQYEEGRGFWIRKKIEKDIPIKDNELNII